MLWDDKRYYSLNYYLRQTFHKKIVKLSLDGGFSCPNRDGTVSTGGCIFCSDRGSGDFSGTRVKSIGEQCKEIQNTISNKWPEAGYIAHFQAFTNTYAPVEVLREKYTAAMSYPNVVGLAVATRPDCLSSPVIHLLAEIQKKHHLWVELGLQTIHNRTAAFINRGYELSCFEEAVRTLYQNNIETVVHLIVGLPGETKEDILASVCYISQLPIKGVKLHGLYVLKNTPLGDLYEQSPFPMLDREQYIHLIADCLECLNPNIVVHRLTGDGPKSLLLAPKWSLHKRGVLNGIDQELMLRQTWQGKRFP